MKIKRNITLLSWFNFFTGFNLYSAIVVIYFAQVTGSYLLAMSIFSVTFLSSAIFEIPTGIFSDKIGRRNTVILGAICAILFSIFYAIGGSYWMLVIGAIFEGLSRSLYSGNNDALLHDTLTDLGKSHDFHTHSGVTSSTEQLASFFGVIIGGVVASWSFAPVMWFSVLTQSICLAIAFGVIEPKARSKESGNIFTHLRSAFKQFLRRPKLRWLSIASMYRFGFGESSYYFQVVFINSLIPLWAVGLVKGLGNLLATAGFYFSGRVIKRYGALNILNFSCAYNRVSNFAALLLSNIFSPFLLATNSLLYGFDNTAGKSLMQKEFSEKERATMGSLNSLGGSLWFALVSIGVGFMGDKFGPVNTLLFINLFMFVTFYFYRKIYTLNK